VYEAYRFIREQPDQLLPRRCRRAKDSSTTLPARVSLLPRRWGWQLDLAVSITWGIRSDGGAAALCGSEGVTTVASSGRQQELGFLIRTRLQVILESEESEADLMQRS
jgi:hypothetical protein